MFFPSRITGQLAKNGLSNHLAGSIDSIAYQVLKPYPRVSSLLLDVSSQIHTGSRVTPICFSLYFELITALEHDNAEMAVEIADKIMQGISSVRPAALAVFAMSSASLGEDRFRMVTGAFSDDFFGESYLLEPDPDIFETRKADLFAALNRIQTEIPELYSELVETIDEIVLARGGSQASGYTFDGASSLKYWGAITLNSSLPKTQLRLIEAIAHEAAHNTLFGLSPYDHFVLNDDSERYTSPLRDDLRPLDGIFHATFVLARMHYAVSRILNGKTATETERQEAITLLEGYRMHFMAGHAVLEKHADYTTNGAHIIAQAASYMAQAAM
jgi:hypothetical protein